MPYIKKEARAKYNGYIRDITNQLNKVYNTDISGELNYIITKLLLSTNPKRYHDYNQLIGILESVKLEFYRRKMSYYENEKIEENGDVY